MIIKKLKLVFKSFNKNEYMNILKSNNYFYKYGELNIELLKEITI